MSIMDSEEFKAAVRLTEMFGLPSTWDRLTITSDASTDLPTLTITHPIKIGNAFIYDSELLKMMQSQFEFRPLGEPRVVLGPEEIDDEIVRAFAALEACIRDCMPRLLDVRTTGKREDLIAARQTKVLPAILALCDALRSLP